MAQKAEEPCDRCGVGAGDLHESGCPREQCPYCGVQLISCFCEDQVKRRGRMPKKDRIPWNGELPGVAECREFGWYAKAKRGGGWVSCQPGEPGQIEDLNRLYAEAVWNPVRKRFVKP